MVLPKNELTLRLLSLGVLLLITFNLTLETKKVQNQKSAAANIFQTITPTLTPTPFEPFPYKIPMIPKARSYRIMLVGDSMIGSLGPNAELLRQHLIENYPENEFVNYNYGFGATSIETLPDRLTKETEYKDQKFQSILSQGLDLITVGSFAYNPLSQESVGEGLEKHLKILDGSIRKIILEKPKSVVAILVPIAPSKIYFAKGVYDLTSEEREKWAEERISYIEGMINYANSKNIPLINVYEKSLKPDGDVNLIYINKDDYIHPSDKGVDLMAKTIADFIYENKIFPK